MEHVYWSNPPVMTICVGEQHLHVLDQWEKDLRSAVQDVVKNPGMKIEGNAAVYGAAKNVPDDILDGTFTITNIGVFESLTGTAIINQPQLGIVAFGSVRKIPRVIETDKGDFIGIRRVVVISLSFDHRIINGATGGLFLKKIKNIIEEWDSNQTLT